MQILETRSYGQPKPIYEAEIKEGERLALYYEISSVPLSEFLGDLIGVQTFRIARNYRPLSTKDGEAEAVTEIYERLGSNAEALHEAVTKHFTRNGFTCQFVNLQGYSQSEWAEVVIYAKAEDITDWGQVVAELKAWWAGDVFTAAHEKLKVYTAEDGEQIGEWETLDATGGVIINPTYWGMVDWQTPDWKTLAADLFGIKAITLAKG